MNSGERKRQDEELCMKRYLGVHIDPTTLRAAVVAGDKPVLVPARDGGLTYSTEGIFTLTEKEGWRRDARRLAQLLKQVREDVIRFAGAGQWEMVLTIPTAFGFMVETAYLRQAAQAAGLPVAYILRESVAVALNYYWNGMGRGEDTFRVAVARVSGDTMGVSVLEIGGDVMEEVAVSGQRGNVTPENLRYHMSETMKEAEEVHALMINHQAGRRLEYRDMLNQLKSAGQKIYAYPEESAAMGAALHGAKLGGDTRFNEFLMLTAVPYDYYVVSASQKPIKLLSRGTCIPTRKSMVFSTSADGQQDVKIVIAEQMSEISPIEPVLQTKLTGLTPRKAGETQVEVTLEMTATGLLQCAAREVQAGAGTARVESLPSERGTGAAGAEKTATTRQQETPTTVAQEAEPAVPRKEEVVSLAEFENFRRRMAKEKDAMYDQGICKALLKFLPVVDSFERGLAMLSPEQKNTEAAVGMERIYRQMQKAMEELGVTPIQALGQPFDLNRHNAVMQTEIPGVLENTVVEEFEKGYMYRDSVLRYSTVKVNK